MKRKLISVLLSVFAILLLMGAGVERNDVTFFMPVAAAELSRDEAVEETVEDAATEQTGTIVAQSGVALSEATPFVPIEEKEEIKEEPVLREDSSLLLNGEPVSLDTKKSIVGGVSYVALRAMAEELDETAVVSWDTASSTVTVQTEKLHLTAREGECYLIANGRYLYLPQGLKMVGGVTMIPLTVLAEAFDATVQWDGTTGIISVTSGSGAILSGDNYYNSDDLFWMSRVIFAESGSEPMNGKIGVGNVVLNRVESPIYPNTLLGVLAQKNQFTTYKNGNLANRTPNASSVIAAKLVLDGAEIAGLERATHFDTGGSSWASKNKTCVAVIGGHKFYG